MAVSVSAFTGLAKAQFQEQLLEAYAKPFPADIDQLVDEYDPVSLWKSILI